jgi:hypothetical protein
MNAENLSRRSGRAKERGHERRHARILVAPEACAFFDPDIANRIVVVDVVQFPESIGKVDAVEVLRDGSPVLAFSQGSDP